EYKYSHVSFNLPASQMTAPPRGESASSHHRKQSHGESHGSSSSGSEGESRSHPASQRHSESRHHHHEGQRYDFSEGDHVIYHPVGGSVQTSTGIVRKILTHTAPAGESGIHAKASEEHPRFIIENDHTHKETAY